MATPKTKSASQTPDITVEVQELLSQAAPTFKNEIAKQVIASSDSGGGVDARVEFYATVTKEDQREVIKIQTWNIDDLYAHTMSPLIEFANALGDLRQQAAGVSQHTEHSGDWEMKATRLFNSMKLLGSFMGTSPQHDELVSLFEIISVSEAPHPLTRKKLDALSKVLSSLEGRIRFTDETVDEVSENLRLAGFDLNYPVALAPAPTTDA